MNRLRLGARRLSGCGGTRPPRRGCGLGGCGLRFGRFGRRLLRRRLGVHLLDLLDAVLGGFLREDRGVGYVELVELLLNGSDRVGALEGAVPSAAHLRQSDLVPLVRRASTRVVPIPRGVPIDVGADCRLDRGGGLLGVVDHPLGLLAHVGVASHIERAVPLLRECGGRHPARLPRGAEMVYHLMGYVVGRGTLLKRDRRHVAHSRAPLVESDHVPGLPVGDGADDERGLAGHAVELVNRERVGDDPPYAPLLLGIVGDHGEAPLHRAHPLVLDPRDVVDVRLPGVYAADVATGRVRPPSHHIPGPQPARVPRRDSSARPPGPRHSAGRPRPGRNSAPKSPL